MIADIRFPDRLQEVFAEFRPQVVFHAAAHKHVPLMEHNPAEAVTNNMLGTRNVVEAALAAGVQPSGHDLHGQGRATPSMSWAPASASPS